MAETAYATAANLLAVLPSDWIDELSRNIDDSSEDGDAVVTACLLDASRDMDAYLGSRYSVPITNSDSLAILRPKCCDIAKFKLMERRFASKYDPACAEAKNNALTWLGRVAKKDANLYGTSEPSQPATYPESVTGTVGSDVPVFTDPNDPDTGLGLL